MFPKAPCKIKFLKSIKKMFPNGLAIPGIAYTQYVFFHDLEVLLCRKHMEAGSEDQVRNTSLKPSVGRARHRAVWRVLERWLLAPQLGPSPQVLATLGGVGARALGPCGFFPLSRPQGCFSVHRRGRSWGPADSCRSFCWSPAKR